MDANTDTCRHESIEDNRLEEIREGLKKQNTVKSDKKCDKIFVDYLQHRWIDKVPSLEYWTYDYALLDTILCKFWFEVRQKNKDRYTVNSLKHLRYALNRNMKKRGHKIDLLTSECFTQNQLAFDDASKLLKKIGYGYVKHYPEIKPSGKLFNQLCVKRRISTR